MIINTGLSPPAAYSDPGEHLTASFLAHENSIFDISWIKGDALMLTASGDQTIKVWDVEHQIDVGVMRGHSGSVKSLSVNPDNSDIFVSGSRDGCFAFWDIRTRVAVQSNSNEISYRPVAMVKQAHTDSKANKRRSRGVATSVTCVVYVKDERMVATAGAKDGVVKFWDSRNLQVPVVQTPPEGPEEFKEGSRLHGISGLSLDPAGTRLIAARVDSRIHMYDVLRRREEH